MEQFLATFQVLASDMVTALQAEGAAAEAVAWFSESMQYNVPGGKMNRGLSVGHALRRLRGDRSLTSRETFDAFVLGWCVEWLQAFFLVSDDLMDKSVTRRGQLCWYRKPRVGSIAVNDAFMLEMCIYKLLRRYFKGQPCYGTLLELFQDTTWQTEIGQLHDLITAPEGDIDLARFTMDRYRLIVIYKTAFYSFYLPVALAMVYAGHTDKSQFANAQAILLVMGEFFQVQDDYLDCYGDPAVIGKIGTDIEDNKCGWLVVQALQRCSPAQRQVLEDNYGRNDAVHVAAVKTLYTQLGLEAVYRAYEEQTYCELMQLIDSTAGTLPKAIFTDFASKIFKRSK